LEKLFKRLSFLLIGIFSSSLTIYAQSIQVGFPVIEEYLRRSQLNNRINPDISFQQRPLNFKMLGDSVLSNESLVAQYFVSNRNSSKRFSPKLGVLPILSSQRIHSGSPYPEVSHFLQTKGFQSYATSGIFGEMGPLSIRIQPEFIYAQNMPYDFGSSKSIYTEYLEQFGTASFNSFYLGQSSIRLNFGGVSIGASTENISWGPGQFNSLLFSHNAFGFKHLTLNTSRPLKTFLGAFEGQIVSGKLENSGLSTSNLVTQRDEWRYLNGINFSYQPKWIPGLFIGASRVFQQYHSFRENTFGGYFPIFEVFQKEKLFDSPSNSVTYDRGGQDQQLTGFLRFFNSKAKAELYFEYGRRDHAFNWREAILNPEHARAYLFGFIKLIDIPNEAHIQIRGEMLQQQESINIIVRYPSTRGGSNWSGHSPVTQGFSHLGQMLGPGIGPSSNIQTLETAWVKGFNKLGLRLDRLNRHQDLYTKKFNDPSLQGRWVDWSLRLLSDWQFNQFLISSHVNFVNSMNYQWQLSENTNRDFPIGANKFSFHTQISLVYFINNKVSR